MNKDYTITHENGHFVYRSGDLSITFYEDGVSIHGAQDTFSGDRLSILLGPDVAMGMIRLFCNPEVIQQFTASEKPRT